MTVANVEAKWVSGNLVFYDSSGNAIFTIDGTNRKVDFASGAVLDADVAVGTILIADGAVDTDQLAADAVDGTKVADDAIDSEHIGDGAIDPAHLAASCVEKLKLAAEVTYSERLHCSGAFDNQTISLGKVLNACTVVAVSYWTGTALGSGAGIDIIDGGTDNNGSDVIDSCSDNLNGLDYNALSTPYALSADDYVKVKFDDFDYETDCVIEIVLEVPLRTVA